MANRKGSSLALHDILRMFNYNQPVALIIVTLITTRIIDCLSTPIKGRLN